MMMTPIGLGRELVQLDQPAPTFKRLLVPLDGSPLAEAVLPRVSELARLTNARLTLLQVIGPAMPELSAYDIVRLPEDDEALTTEARAYLSRVAGTLRERGLDVDTEIRFGDPAERITEETALYQHDLVAMGTHARRGIDRLVIGSVADRVLRTARVPLLFVRP